MREYGIYQRPESKIDDGQGGGWGKVKRFFRKNNNPASIEKVAQDTEPEPRNLPSPESFERLDELKKILESLNINVADIQQAIHEKQSLSTNSQEVFQYVKLYTEVMGLSPVVEITLDRDFTSNGALERLNAVIPGGADRKSENPALVTFADRIKASGVALAVSVASDVNYQSAEVRDFANSARAYQQHHRGFV